MSGQFPYKADRDKMDSRHKADGAIPKLRYTGPPDYDFVRIIIITIRGAAKEKPDGGSKAIEGNKKGSGGKERYP